jgi:DNA transposition AAA+ family ATPase
MTTRRQKGDSNRFRPDAFASSAAFERGLLANLVALRCGVLSDPEEITMLWWLQQISWREGGIEQFAERFLEANQDRIGTRSMHKFGMAKGQIYTAEQVRIVREELASEEDFPLRGERKADLGLAGFLGGEHSRVNYTPESTYPNSYPVSQFTKLCECCAMQLAEHLKSVATNPAGGTLKDGLWNFPGLWQALVAWREKDIAAAEGSVLETEITRKVAEELDFALQSRAFVLIEGREGVGKTEAAKSWCAKHPGQAIYVRLESGSDEATLYRSIARSLGTACSYGRKATEMRLRVQDALQPGQLMLVLDEAHFLWPQSDRAARSAPKRVDWLRTALVDFGVPVALISTPQYFKLACDKFRKGGWNANQIERRLTHTVLLPEALRDEEMESLARWYFPNLSAADTARICMAASGEIGFLTVFRHLRQRMDFVARCHPRKSEAQCLDLVLREHPAANPPAPAAVPAAPARLLQAHCRPNEQPVPTRGVAPANLPIIRREQSALAMT